LKILFPFVGDSVGGSHHSIIELHRELCKNNIPSVIVVHQKGPLSLFLEDAGVLYEYLPIQKFAGEKPNIFSILYGIFVNFNKIYGYIQRNGISIVHGNDLRVNLTWSFPTKLSHASYVWHQRTTMSSSYLWSSIYLLADYFVTISSYVHETLPDNILSSNKKLILNPFDTTTIYNKTKSRHFIESAYSIPKNVLIVGYIGRLVEWKNVDFLIKCISEYSNDSIRLLIVGTGKDKYVSKLKNLARNCDSIVTFAGFNNNPNKIIAGLDLMVAPSNTEPFGRTLIESMIQKTPVLAAKGGGHMEIIRHGDTGWLYDHGNITDFITQLHKIMQKGKVVDSAVQRAYMHACSKYSSAEHAKNIISIYNRLY
jgi:glycosyltransferase involved in cell wall biosynthesis